MIQSKPTYSYAWFCTAALTLCWFITSMYLPAIPNLQSGLAASESQIKFFIAIFFVFFGLGQIIWGPISDNYRRNTILFATLLIAVIGTILCSIATNIWAFGLGRILQGLGIGSIPALSRSIVNDYYEEKVVIKIMIYLTSVVALASSIAPFVGAGLLKLFDWRSIFIFQIIFCALLLVYNFFVMAPNYKTVSNSKPKRSPFYNYYIVMQNRKIWFYFVSYFLITSSLVAFYSASPFILINILGFSTLEYSSLLLAASVFYILAIFVVRLLINVLTPMTMILYGTLLCVIGGLLLFIFSFFMSYSLLNVGLPIAIYFFGSAFIPPITNSKAMHVYPKLAGTVSSLMGTGLSLGSALLSYILLSLPLTNLCAIGAFYLIVPLIVFIYVVYERKTIQIV